MKLRELLDVLDGETRVYVIEHRGDAAVDGTLLVADYAAGDAGVMQWLGPLLDREVQDDVALDNVYCPETGDGETMLSVALEDADTDRGTRCR